MDAGRDLVGLHDRGRRVRADVHRRRPHAGLKGPKICALLGGVLVSAGFFLASFTTSLTLLYIFFGVIVGLGNGFGYSTPMPVASKWFPDKRGLIVGLMVGGYGGGSAIFGPLARRLIPSIGWRPTFQILGAVFFVMTMIGTVLLKNPPPGYRPPNWQPQARRRRRRRFHTREMLATPTFYFLWVAYCARHDGGTDDHQPAGAVCRHGRPRRARSRPSLLPVTPLGNAGGRILSGWMSDTLGRVRTLKMMVAASRRWRCRRCSSGASRRCVLRPRVRGLLVLRHAAVGLRLDDSRLLRHEEPGPELRCALHGVGRRRHPRARPSPGASSWLRRLPVRVLRGRGACPRGIRVAVDGQSTD